MEWTIYWVTRLDSIRTALSAFLLLWSVGLFSYVLARVMMMGDDCYADSRKENPAIRRHLLHVSIIGIVVAVVVGTVLVLLPTMNEMAAILIIPRILENPRVGELPDALLTWAITMLTAGK